MEDFICNVLMLGATGAGKSSLLNYLCGKNLAKAGAGKPVTGDGIFEYDVALNGQAVRIFDSWGIEADNVSKWESIIKEKLKEHSADKPIGEWFHSVVYCIQAGGTRIQPVDSKIIRQFYREGYNVVIVLTKADQVTKDEETEMKKAIRLEVESSVKEGKSFNVISCCSVEKNTRCGATKAFGRNEIIEQIIKNWWYTVLDRIPWYVIKKLEDEIDIWGEKTKNKISNEYTIYGTKKANIDVYKKLKEEFDTFRTRLNNEILQQTIYEAIGMCNKSCRALCVILEQENLCEDKSPTDIKIDLGRFIIEVVKNIIMFIEGSFNPKNIEKQKNIMVQLIEKLKEALKERVRSNEKQIKEQIEKSIL